MSGTVLMALSHLMIIEIFSGHSRNGETKVKYLVSGHAELEGGRSGI